MSEQNSTVATFPVSPPRVRVEWLIAGVRVALAVSALLAFLIDAPNYFPPYFVTLVFVGYLVYGLAVLALVWSPVQFGRGWDLAVHVFDLLVFVAGCLDDRRGHQPVLCVLCLHRRQRLACGGARAAP